MTSARERGFQIQKLVDQIKLLMAGNDSAIQGAALADLLAIWLAGHDVDGDEDATRSLRAELLAMHCFNVRMLVPINARIIGTTP